VVVIVETAVVIATTVLAVTLTIATWVRTRGPEKKRDLWLSANAQPVLSALNNASLLVLFVVSGANSALIASLGYPFLWAVSLLCAGGIASLAITVARTRQGRPRGFDIES
jgi:hypothetical protein